jgi:hypothetical protein
MVLDMDREALLARNKARPARDRPALHGAVKLETKIVVQPAGGVLLDHVAVLAGRARAAPARLAGRLEIPLLAVQLQTARFH